MNLTLNPQTKIYQATGDFSFENCCDIFKQILTLEDGLEIITINFNHIDPIHLASVQALVIIKSKFENKYFFNIQDIQMKKFIHRFGLTSYFSSK